VRNKFNTAQVYWEARERDAEGNLRHYMHHRIGGLGNDTHVFREHDSASSRLTSIKAGFSDGSQTDLQHLTYAYDTIGNMVSRRDEKLNAGLGIEETFGYDKLNRVTSSKLGSDFSAFSYTANGNLDVKDKGLILGGTRKAAKFIYCSVTSHRVCSTRDNANQATVQSFTYDGNNPLGYKLADDRIVDPPVHVDQAGEEVLVPCEAAVMRAVDRIGLAGALLGRIVGPGIAAPLLTPELVADPGDQRAVPTKPTVLPK
jgi:hypothetical protein